MIAGYVDRRMQEGALRHMDPVLAAKSFICMVAHYAQSCVVFECDDPSSNQHEVIHVMVNIFLQGIQKTTE